MLKSFLINVGVRKASKFISKRFQHRCFPVNIAKKYCKYFEEQLNTLASQVTLGCGCLELSFWTNQSFNHNFPHITPLNVTPTSYF